MQSWIEILQNCLNISTSKTEYPIAALKRLTLDTDIEARKSSEDLDIDGSKERVKELLSNLMLLKKDIEEKKNQNRSRIKTNRKDEKRN